MEYIEKIKKMLCKELEAFSVKPNLTVTDLEKIHKLTDTVKNLDKIKMFEEESEGYSERRGGGRSSYERGGSSYDDDMMYSERRGRGRNAKRDSMGRYSSEGGSYEYSEEGGSYRRGGQGGSSYRGGSSYEGGMSSYDEGKDHMMSMLGGMMEDANPNEREILKDCMRKLERM